jgi:hypothetical protein
VPGHGGDVASPGFASGPCSASRSVNLGLLARNQYPTQSVEEDSHIKPQMGNDPGQNEEKNCTNIQPGIASGSIETDMHAQSSANMSQGTG